MEGCEVTFNPFSKTPETPMQTDVAKGLVAKVAVPQSKADRTDVKYEEIPLPPVEMWNELDNSKVKVEPAAAVLSETRQIERLAFRHGETKREIALQFPFDHAVHGPIDTITIRRLTVGEVGDVISNRPLNPPDLFDIYGAMCGLPAETLRGLIDVDGEKVTEICFDFLPRLFRPRTMDQVASSST